MSDDDRGMSARRRQETRGRTGSRPAPRVRRSTAARLAANRPALTSSDHVSARSVPGAPSSTVDVQAAVGGTVPSAPAGGPGQGRDAAELIRIAVDAALRAALAMFAGFVGTVAVGLVLWAVTPGTDLGAEPAVRAATAAYVLAHFGHIEVGGATLTIAPLLLTLLCGLLLAIGPGRSRAFGGSAADELFTVAVGVVTYTALVVVAAVTLAPPGAGVLGAAIGAFVISTTALGLGVVRRGPRVRELATECLPGWATVGLTGAAAAVATIVAGAGMVFVIALVLRFTTAADLAATLSPGGGDAAGLALAGLAYLPNAVLATVGYSTGVGFDIGAGSYGPFGSVPADLPPFPLLAAVPGSSGVSAPGLATLVLPIAAGLAVATVVLRRVADRRDRLAAVGVAAVGAGLVIGLAVWAGSGGVTGGSWPFIGAVGWQVGPVLALCVAVVAGAWIAAAGRTSEDPIGDATTAHGPAAVGEGPAGEGPVVVEPADGEGGAGAPDDGSVADDTVDGDPADAGSQSDERGDSATAGAIIGGDTTGGDPDDEVDAGARGAASSDTPPADGEGPVDPADDAAPVPTADDRLDDRHDDRHGAAQNDHDDRHDAVDAVAVAPTDQPGAEPIEGAAAAPTEGRAAAPTEGAAAAPTDGPPDAPVDGPPAAPTDVPTAGQPDPRTDAATDHDEDRR